MMKPASPEAMAHYVTAYRMAGDPGGNAAALACVGGGTAKALKRELERQTTACPVPPTCEFVPTRATAKDLAAELPLSENTRVLYQPVAVRSSAMFFEVAALCKASALLTPTASCH